MLAVPRMLAGGSKLLQNIGTYIPMHMASHPRWLESSRKWELHDNGNLTYWSIL